MIAYRIDETACENQREDARCLYRTRSDAPATTSVLASGAWQRGLERGG
jgi:hypothetical protein